MNIRCPHCQTLFRVDPARVPPRGIRARCARCGGTFQIAGTSAPDASAASGGGAAPAASTWRTTPHSPGAAAAPRSNAPPGPAPAAGAVGPQPATTTPTRQTQQAGAPPSPADAPRDAERTARGAHASGTAEPPGRGQAAAPAGGAPQRPVFGSRDPNARAQRIARALVSDIVAYHPERRDQALEAGTLRGEFRDEIMKSWDEYVAQVGQETAKSTPYFRQALNDILARGQAVF